MALRDWITKYPGVQALLQRPDDAVPPTAEEAREDGAVRPDVAGLYRLEGHTPVPVADLLTWARWHATADRRVALTRIGTVEVSTVFLGLDHQWGSGPPLLFETLAFRVEEGARDALGHLGARYSTWADAVAGHAALCARVLATQPEAR